MRRTSEIPKRPMATGTSPTPSMRMGMSKVNRSVPERMSMPMHPRKIPRAAMQSALGMESPARKVSMMTPMIIREKYSGGPNCRATSARGGATSMRPTTLMVPPMKEPMAEMPRAGPALPWRAIWYPSRQVTTEAASPGILSRMEVVEPPYMAP